MGLRINTNIAALSAQRQLFKTEKSLERSLKVLSSGNRFANSSEGSADFAISENLRSQISSTRAAQANAENANSFIQVAEGSLNEQNNILIRLRELSIQAASDTFSSQERVMLNTEFDQLSQEFDRIAKIASFGSQKLLNGTEKTYDFQVGAYGSKDDTITYTSNTNTSLKGLDLEGLSILDKTEARDSLARIDKAQFDLASARASFGAIQNRLGSVVNNSANQIENLERARSVIADANIPEVVSDVYRLQAMKQYQVQVLNQANQNSASVLKLFA